MEILIKLAESMNPDFWKAIIIILIVIAIGGLIELRFKLKGIKDEQE